MATPKKLSELTELAAAPDSADEFYLRDVSEPDVTEPKRITVANAHAALRAQGKETIWVPAGAAYQSQTNPATLNTIEITSATPVINVYEFDPDTKESVEFNIAFPKSWDEGTITYQVHWSQNGSSTDDVVWGLEAVARQDGGALGTAFGTAITVTDTGSLTLNIHHVSPESSPLTIGGGPAENEIVFFRFFRDAANAADTMANDARLIGIRLFYTTNAKDDT